MNVFLVELELNRIQLKPSVWFVRQDNIHQLMELVKLVHQIVTRRMLELIDVSHVSVDEKLTLLEPPVFCVTQGSIHPMTELVNLVHTINSPRLLAHAYAINVQLELKKTPIVLDVFCAKLDSFHQTIKLDAWNVRWDRFLRRMERANVSNVLQEVNLMLDEPIVTNVLLDKHLLMVCGVKLVQQQRFPPLLELENVLLANVDSKRIQLETLVSLVLLDHTLPRTAHVKLVHEVTCRYLLELVNVSNVLLVTKRQEIELFVCHVQQERILLMEQIVRNVNRDILLRIQLRRHVKLVRWVMETRRILRSVVLVLLDLARSLERFARLVNLEKYPMLEGLVNLVLKTKETLVPRINVILVLLERPRLKEVSVFDVPKARLVVLEDDVKLVLQVTNLTVAKQIAWNVLKELSRPMARHVFLVLLVKSPPAQELFSACYVQLGIRPIVLEPTVLLARRDSVLWLEATVCNVFLEAPLDLEVCVKLVQLVKETPPPLLESVLLVLQDGVRMMVESVSSVLWDKILILEAYVRTVSLVTVLLLVACVNLVRLDRVLCLEVNV